MTREGSPAYGRLKLPAVRRWVESSAWAIHPARGAALLELLEVRAASRFAVDGPESRDAEARDARSDRKPITKTGGAIAVLPFYGVVAQRMDMMMALCGGVSTEKFADDFDAAMADPQVSAIVIDCDSPGGNVQGTPELAKRILAARGKGKKIVAVANGTMASAAYWICSAADEVVCTPSGDVGSIGVFCVHQDESGMYDQLGVKFTIIKAGEHKAEGNPFEPLSADAERFIQGQIDEMYSSFVQAVAKQRGVAIAKVNADFGQGRCFTAKQALAAGMIDRIATLEDTLKRLGATNIGASGRPKQAFGKSGAVMADDEAIPAHLVETGPIPQAAKKKSDIADPDEDDDDDKLDPDEDDADNDSDRNNGDLALGSPTNDGAECPECGALMNDDGSCSECDYQDPPGNDNDRAKGAKIGARSPLRIAASNTFDGASWVPSVYTNVTSGLGTSGPVAISIAPPIPSIPRVPDAARGDSPAASRATPSTSPAATAEEQSVREATTAAPTGATVDLQAVIAAERKRVSEIIALCKQEKVSDDVAASFISSDKSVADVSYELMTQHRAAHNGRAHITVGAPRETERPFNTLGENLHAIIKAERSGGRMLDPRLLPQASATGMGELVPSDGGFAIQPDFAEEIFNRAYTMGEILSRVRKVPISATSNGLKMNAVDETSRANGSRYGGIQVQWASEADQAPNKKPKLRQIELNLKKLIGSWFLTDELAEDTTAMSAVATEGFSEECTFVTEDAIVNGDGAGKPLGIVGSPGVVTVAKETGQAATTFVTANAAKIFGRMWGRSVKNAVWLINQDVWQQLLQLTLGASNWPVFVPPGGASQAPYGTLYGREIVPVEYCQTLGAPGDVIFADLSQYLVIDKGGPQQAQSIHVKFLTDEMTFRITYRVDGQPLWNKALTPKNGANTLSPFVVVAAR